MRTKSTSIRPFDRLDRCSQFVRLIRDDLKELLQEPADVESARWIAALVDKLMEDFEDERLLKNGDGYLDGVLEQYPSWQTHVTQLRERQTELADMLHDIRCQMDRENPTAGYSVRCYEALRDWIAASEEQEYRERMLTLDAFTLDVGTGD